MNPTARLQQRHMYINVLAVTNMHIPAPVGTLGVYVRKPERNPTYFTNKSQPMYLAWSHIHLATMTKNHTAATWHRLNPSCHALNGFTILQKYVFSYHVLYSLTSIQNLFTHKETRTHTVTIITMQCIKTDINEPLNLPYCNTNCRT